MDLVMVVVMVLLLLMKILMVTLLHLLSLPNLLIRMRRGLLHPVPGGLVHGFVHKGSRAILTCRRSGERCSISSIGTIDIRTSSSRDPVESSFTGTGTSTTPGSGDLATG